MSNVQVSFDNVQVYLKCTDLSILKFSAMQCWSWLLTINNKLFNNAIRLHESNWNVAKCFCTFQLCTFVALVDGYKLSCSAAVMEISSKSRVSPRGSLRVHLKVSGSEHTSSWQGTGRHLWSHEAATTSNKLARRELWPGQADPRLGAGRAGAIKTPSPPLSDGEMRQLRMSDPLLVRCRGWPWRGWKYSLIKTPSSPPRWFMGRIPPAPCLLRPPAAGAFLLRPEIIYISGLSHCRNFSPSLRRNVWKYLRRVWKYFVARTQLTKCFQILYTIEVYELWNRKRRALSSGGCSLKTFKL